MVALMVSDSFFSVVATRLTAKYVSENDEIKVLHPKYIKQWQNVPLIDCFDATDWVAGRASTL